MKFLPFYLILFAFASPLYAQPVATTTDNDPDPAGLITKSDYGYAAYFEFLGRGYYSLNFEMPVGLGNRLSFGISMNDMEVNISDDEHDSFSCLIAMGMFSHLFGKGPHYFELGAGLSYTFLDIQNWQFPVDLHESEDPFALNGFAGYRYQGKKGFLFRIGFTPLITIPQGNLWPLGGISAGYSW